jgi:hypothetical protein
MFSNVSYVSTSAGRLPFLWRCLLCSSNRSPLLMEIVFGLDGGCLVIKIACPLLLPATTSFFFYKICLFFRRFRHQTVDGQWIPKAVCCFCMFLQILMSLELKSSTHSIISLYVATLKWDKFQMKNFRFQVY